MTLKADQIIGGHYKIVKKLGEGAFGVTYQAVDTHSLNDPCVIKQLRLPSHSSSHGKKGKELFEREAEALHKIKNHRNPCPYLPQFYAHFPEGEETYIVQEFIEGHNLREELTEKGKLSEEAVIKLLKDVLEGLKFLHAQGMIHRDIKPENLMRRTSDNSIVIIDLGAVKEKKESSPITTSETILLTPNYAAPEQYDGILLESTDIYALGMTAIRALTGKKFDNLKDDQKIVQWPEDVKISPELKILLERMVEHKYEDRYYATANHALNDLEKLSDLSHKPPSTSSNETHQLPSKKPSWITQFHEKKNLLILIVLGIGLVSFVGFLVAPQVSQIIKQLISKPTIPEPFSKLSSFTTSEPITALDITKDGKTVILGHDNGSVSIWTVETPRKLNEFTAHNGHEISALTISADGQRLVTTSNDNKGIIKVWNVVKPQEEAFAYDFVHNASPNANSQIYALAMTPNGQTLVSGDSGAGTGNQSIRVWTLERNKEELFLSPILVDKRIESLAVNQDASIIAAGKYGGEITIFSKEINFQQYYFKSILNEKHSFIPQYVAISLDGKTIVNSSCQAQIRIFQWNTINQKMQEKPPIATQGNICVVAVSPDGKWVAGLSQKGSLSIWDIDSGKQNWSSPINQDISGASIAFSDDGKTLVVAFDSTINVWRWNSD